jgi:DNA-binding MarR family transcriptional regulator
MSQNELGRRTAIDTATIKGVVDRLIAKGLLEQVSTDDARRRITDLTPEGRNFYEKMVPVAKQITSETLEPLTVEERATFIRLLKKLG